MCSIHYAVHKGESGVHSCQLLLLLEVQTNIYKKKGYTIYYPLGGHGQLTNNSRKEKSIYKVMAGRDFILYNQTEIQYYEEKEE